MPITGTLNACFYSLWNWPLESFICYQITQVKKTDYSTDFPLENAIERLNGGERGQTLNICTIIWLLRAGNQ